jgi:hypothetical protein
VKPKKFADIVISPKVACDERATRNVFEIESDKFALLALFEIDVHEV